MSGYLSNTADYIDNIPFETTDADKELHKIRSKERRDDPYGFSHDELDSRFWPERKPAKLQRASNGPQGSDILKQFISKSTQNSSTSSLRKHISKTTRKVDKIPQYDSIVLRDKRGMYCPIYERFQNDHIASLHFNSFVGDCHCPFERGPKNIHDYLKQAEKTREAKRCQAANTHLPSPGAMGMNFCELCKMKFKDAKMHHDSEHHRACARGNIWAKVDQIAAAANEEFLEFIKQSESVKS